MAEEQQLPGPIGGNYLCTNTGGKAMSASRTVVHLVLSDFPFDRLTGLSLPGEREPELGDDRLFYFTSTWADLCRYSASATILKSHEELGTLFSSSMRETPQRQVPSDWLREFQQYARGAAQERCANGRGSRETLAVALVNGTSRTRLLVAQFGPMLAEFKGLRNDFRTMKHCSWRTK